MSTIFIKSIAVKKPNAQVVQIPNMVSILWQLKEDDKLVMELSEDTKQLIIRRATQEEIGQMADATE